MSIWSALMNPQLFRIILTFVLAYLIFRIFTSWILPAIARWYIMHFRKKFYRQNPQARQAEERKKKGGMHISYDQNADKTNTGNIGEYVDFEELKDDENK